MAKEEKEKDLDLDVEQKGKSKTTLLIIVLIVVVLAVGGGVAALLLLGDDSEGAKDGVKSEKAAPAPAADAIYSELRPTFIINFEDTSKARYVQLDLTVMAHTQKSIDLVQEHSPVIRNNIIAILSGQKYEVLSTYEGKQKLRAELLNSINQTIATEVNNMPAADPKADGTAAPLPPGNNYIKAVYFTSLVMQ